VVNQWWASLVSAKGMSGPALDVLRHEGYPDFSHQYDAIALGSRRLPPDAAPWGGLPRPSVVVAERRGDATAKIFEAWQDDRGTAYFPLERSALVDTPDRWWELVPDRWEEAFGSDRIDLLESEIRLLVEFLTERTGRRLDVDRLAEVMDLVNEQAEWNRRTRDLLAGARPLPVAVNDSIPAVMIPQWHRGSRWARDAAEALYRETEQLVAAGAALCPQERLRLMWIGRGLWHDLDLYRDVMASHGAVVVWSMYLAVAADGYQRRGPDPLRALAARFVGITDQLYVPPWSSQWYVKEARTHGVDAVVHLVADDVPGSWFVTQALRDEGFPVLEVVADNADQRDARTDVRALVTGFLDQL